MANNCPICRDLPESQGGNVDPASRSPGEGLTLVISCPRCGRFELPSHLADNPGKPEETALRLSAATRRVFERDGLVRFTTSDSMTAFAAATPPPVTFSGYIDATLGELAEIAKFPGRESDVRSLVVLAARTFLGLEDSWNLIRQLGDEGLLVVSEGDRRRFKARLTPTGWKRVDELRRRGGRLGRAFVAMSFSEQMRPAYADGIRPALEACGYRPPFRVDDVEWDEAWKDTEKPEKRIDDRILAEIRRSRFVVADFTGERPNVYFEAGFAEGLGIDVIWTCSDDAKDNLAFDTRQNEHIIWTTPIELKERLRAKIERRGWSLKT